MSTLQRRDTAGTASPFGRLDRLFDEWMRSLPMRRPLGLVWDPQAEDVISAERRIEKDAEDKGYTRHELRYGRFTRMLPLPEGATASDIAAAYKDGILEIRVPVPQQPTPGEPTRIAISKS